MVAAQNDLYMCTPSVSETREPDDVARQLAAGYLTRGELQRNARNILRFLLSGQALLRLTGRLGEETEPVYTLPVDEDSLAAGKCCAAQEGGSAIVIDGSVLHPRRGRAELFDILAPRSGPCRVSAAASSPMTALAQLPVSVYCDSKFKATLVMQGTEGAVAEHAVSLGHIEAGRHTISLFYGASGLDFKTLTLQWE